MTRAAHALACCLLTAASACGTSRAPRPTPTARSSADRDAPTRARRPRPERGWVWAIALASSHSARATGVAADASGHVYVTGSFSGVMTLGNTQLEARDAERFVARLSADDGTAQWARSLGPGDPLAPSTLALTPSGDVVVGGELGARAIVSAFAAADGRPLWATAFSGKQRVEIRGMAANPAGDLVVGGTLFGDATVGDTRLFHVGGSDVFLVARAGADGSVVWAETVGNPGDNSTRSVAVDDAGNAYVAGSFSGTVNVGDVWLAAPGKASDVFVASFDGAGKVRWANQLNVGSTTIPWDLAVDAAGDTAVVGVFTGATRINGQPATSAGGFDGFAATHDPAGAPGWTAQQAGPHADSWRTVDYNLAGQVLITGTADVRKHTAGGLSRSAGGKLVVVALSPRGEREWTVTASADDELSPLAAAVDPFGFVYVAGSFARSLQFGDRAVTAEGAVDAYVAKLRP